jgi:pantothenate kinase
LSHESLGHVTSPVASVVSLDGYHLSRSQLSALADPVQAHARRGAAFTFDDKAFLTLVRCLREPLSPDTPIVYAPSFDHAIKDPVENDIPILPTAKIVLFEGNYLSLNKGLWREAASLMDELWFVEVDLDIARRRLVARHVRSGIVKDNIAADRRVSENDFVNGKEILQERLPIQEIIESKEHAAWQTL